MLQKPQLGSSILLLCMLGALTVSAGCAALHERKTQACRLSAPFHHGDMTILGWEHPLISPESTGREARLIVIFEGSPIERHVKLKQNLGSSVNHVGKIG